MDERGYAPAMITAIIRVKHGPEALSVTLSALIPAVAAGLVGDAVILAEKQDTALAKVADAVGATLVVTEEKSWKAGAQAARRDWLLCLDDGDVPQEGWIRALDRFVGTASPEQGLARLRRQRAGLLSGTVDLVGGLLGAAKIRAGDLVHRRVLLDQAKARAPVRLPATIVRDPAFG